MDKSDKIFGAFFLLISIIFPFVLAHECQKSKECKIVNVVQIGGCNKYGCGVRLDDGRKISIANPVLGENEICGHQ